MARYITVLVLLCAATAAAATGNYTFNYGETLTSTKLNNALAEKTNDLRFDNRSTVTTARIAAKVTAVNATAPIVSSGGISPTISINAASTSAAGAVQLTDSVSSTSTTTAATPNSVKQAYDLANGKTSYTPATPGNIGTTTPGTGAFTTLSATGQITSTLANGTAPFAVTSSTLNANLNSDQLDGQHGSYYRDMTNVNAGILPSTYGGTGNGFTKFGGPATAEKTFTLPNASAAILTDNTAVTGAQGGTGVNNSGKTITLGGNLTTSGAFATTLTVTGTTSVTLPTSGTLIASGGALGTPSSGTLTNATGLPIAGVTGWGTGVATALGNTLGGAGGVTTTIASGTSALGTSAIASGACATAVTTAATNVATTDVINWGFNGDPTSVTGYAPTSNGMLTIIAYPTANNVGFRVCNLTAASITPGAITLNWRVNR